jgi:hypothetical protein
MTKKVFTVTKSVKVDGVELVTGDDVSLEPGQAESLLGTFVEEKGSSKPVTSSATVNKTKGADGL